ncbi:hypothetical protein WG902_14815 [Ramlibacter sp. PS3R-8]|uniref:hypothetical protein n=1 Tax=Ramlibacter sp. PS3R-8 TaxID=3133437 RepID=UPI003095D5D3
MKLLAHPFAFCLALVSPWSHADVPDSSLMGCWRAVKIVQHFKSGSTGEDTSGRCTLQFKEDQFESSCLSTIGTITSTYRYRVDRPNVYSATMTGSTFRTSLIGSTREYEYQVDGDRLRIAINLQPAEPVPATVAIRLETEASRMACP